MKSRCREIQNNGVGRWCFTIKKNKVANYFICIAFDDRKTLNPVYLWLIPGDLVNEKTSLSITDSPRSLTKWSKYERPLDNVLECCNKLRGIDQRDITASNATDSKV